MLRPLPLVLATALAVSGCARLAESRFNPLNWFGAATAAAAPRGPLVPAGQGGTYDLRQPIAAVTDLVAERDGDGAILRATGIAATQGWHNAQLVPLGVADGVATYAFRVEPPETAQPAGPEAARTITVARRLDAADLAGIAAIRVQGQTNTREIRR